MQLGERGQVTVDREDRLGDDHGGLAGVGVEKGERPLEAADTGLARIPRHMGDSHSRRHPL